MYDQIKRDTQAPYYQDRFDNDGQRFVAWYVQNIHRRDMIGTVEDVTDGPDDKQIDANCCRRRRFDSVRNAGQVHRRGNC